MITQTKGKQIRQTYTLQSDAVKVVHACAWLNQILTDCNINQAAIYQLETVLSEILNNIIIHAYSYQPTEKIIIHCKVMGGRVVINVDDFGKGLNEIPKITPVNEYSENGRGWVIIRSWTDAVRYRKYASMNRISIIKKYVNSTIEGNYE